MKVLWLYYGILALLNILGVNDLFGLDSGLILAMAIPIGGLYTNTSLGLGRIFSHHPNTFVETRAAETEILFGRALEFGTQRNQVKVVDSVDEFCGVAMYSVQASKLSEEKYSVGDVVGVCTSGYVTVWVEEAVNVGDVVRVRHSDHATLTNKVKGNFCKTAEAGKTYKLEGARFESSTTGEGEAVVWLSGNFKIVAD